MKKRILNRDPSGFIFMDDGIIYRQINDVYKKNYEYLKRSGLLYVLQKEKLLIDHEEMGKMIIKPRLIPFVSYPYEWSFSMLKDAALLTLDIQKKALEHNMSLKDASAYNIQFFEGSPVMIDTLSFEKYEEGLPWVAYRQFCQHFFGPLSLMIHTDIRLNQLMKIYLDGIPLDLTSRLLPKKTYFDFSLLTHIHLHSKSQIRYADKQVKIQKSKIKMSLFQLKALIENLYSAIKKLELKKTDTEWGDYYNFTNYDKQAMEDKARIIEKLIKKTKSKTVWDLGANDGQFSRIAAKNFSLVVSFDIDPVAVEKNYLRMKNNKEKNILPILLDLSNPSSDYGFMNEERLSFMKRPAPDCVMALALIHHLAIGNNLPLHKIAEFFHKLSDNLIIEFVPKEDSQVKKMLSSREDIFLDYTEDNFEKIFGEKFKLVSKRRIKNSLRAVYLFRKI